jgi:hypothetical protein
VSPAFAFPDWAAQSDPPPSSSPPAVDPHRIGDLVNGFITAKQDALFDAPDALYRQGGADAVAGADGVAQRLVELRDTTLEQAADDGERQTLRTQLDAQLADALDGIDRHVARERDVHHRQILSERQRLIERAAGLEHNNDAKLAGLADANAGTAQVRARLDGLPEEPAMQAARSAVWRSAIGRRLVAGQNSDAVDLFQRVNDQLVPGDQRALDVPIQAARTDAAADAWIAREQDKPGEPLPVRVQADPDLSPAEKAATLAKIEVRDSAKESARADTVAGLDDKLAAAADALATKPGTYGAGTLAALANGYEEAGETDKARTIRRLAQREGFLRSFAISSVDAQQRLIDSLPAGDDRAAVEAIRDRQAEAFAKDAFAAGTALYPDVGPPKPIDDVAGRVAQARAIAAYRGTSVVPFTADEIAEMHQLFVDGPSQERDATLARLTAMPADVQVAVASALGASGAEQEEGPRRTADPNVILAADKDKDLEKIKTQSLPGGGSRPRFGLPDDEMPRPKQIDPLGGKGVPGFRLPGVGARPLPKAPVQGTGPTTLSGNRPSTQSRAADGSPQIEREADAARRETVKQQRADQIRKNYAAGREFEKESASELEKRKIEFGAQVTVELPSGRRIRPDFLTRDPKTGELGCIECKASKTGEMPRRQEEGYSELSESGGAVVGKGKPGFSGGMTLPPLEYELWLKKP